MSIRVVLIILVLLLSSLPTHAQHGPYLKDLERRIRFHWSPPDADGKAYSIIASFKVYPNGTMADLRLQASSGVAIADQAALKAVMAAAPFRQLPASNLGPIDIQAYFRSNGSSSSLRKFSPTSTPIWEVKCTPCVNSVTLFEKLQAARTLFDAKDWEQAKDGWEEVLILTPDDPEGLYKRAVCYLHFYSSDKWMRIRSEKYAQALSDLQKAKIAYEEGLDTTHATEIGRLIDELRASEGSPSNSNSSRMMRYLETLDITRQALNDMNRGKKPDQNP